MDSQIIQNIADYTKTDAVEVASNEWVLSGHNASMQNLADYLHRDFIPFMAQRGPANTFSYRNKRSRSIYDFVFENKPVPALRITVTPDAPRSRALARLHASKKAK